VLAELATSALLTDDAGRTDAERDVTGFYDDVDVATGMPATELRVSPEDALLRLRAHAFSHRQSLTEVARAVVLRRIELDSPSE
jgi:hypothetical protein